MVINVYAPHSAKNFVENEKFMQTLKRIMKNKKDGDRHCRQDGRIAEMDNRLGAQTHLQRPRFAASRWQAPFFSWRRQGFPLEALLRQTASIAYERSAFVWIRCVMSISSPTYGVQHYFSVVVFFLVFHSGPCSYRHRFRHRRTLSF